MNELKETIVIKKPVEEVFAFCIDPANTPKWVESIITEETNEWPAKIGTIYRNRDSTGAWSAYTLTTFVPNETFTLGQNDGNYLRYTFNRLTENSTELTYEWIGEDSERPELKEILINLKTVIDQE